MRSILKATAVLGGGSMANIVTGVISAKVSAVLLGPAGMGFMGLLQSFLGLTVLVASMGVGAGLVRTGAHVLAQGLTGRAAALRAGAWRACWILGGLMVVAMIVFRRPLSELMLGGPYQRAVVVSTVALLFMLAAGLQTHILNMHHRVGDLARASVVSNVLSVTVSLFIVWVWRVPGLVWAVGAAAVVNWAVFSCYARRVPVSRGPLTEREVWDAARHLLRFGVPFTASQLVGTGVFMMLPVLVLHALSTDHVGFYRSATTVSITYLSFLVTAMSQDYYPRLSAVGDDPIALGGMINDQCRLVLLVAGPAMLGMLALVPYLIPLVYSPQFMPAVDLLEWQLIGDIFKFTAWTMSFVILTRSGGLAFFGIELFGGTVLLSSSWLGMRWLGLEGLGVGFVACTASYCALCWLILRRAIGLRWTRANMLNFSILVIAAAIVRLLPYVGWEHLRTPVALTLAAAAGTRSLYVIWAEMGGRPGLVMGRRSS